MSSLLVKSQTIAILRELVEEDLKYQNDRLKEPRLTPEEAALVGLRLMKLNRVLRELEK